MARLYAEPWNRRELGVADEIFAADCVTHQFQSGAASAGTPRGPKAVKEHVAEWHAGFPDLHFEVEAEVAEANLVSSRAVMRGTHTGGWLGIAASGKEVSIRMCVTHRIERGKIAEDCGLVEALGFVQQLGLVPETRELLSATHEVTRHTRAPKHGMHPRAKTFA